MAAKILVIDDNRQVRKYLCKMLIDVGSFSVEMAETTKETLQKSFGPGTACPGYG
jgi:CheY-like chemotaxis protein